MNKSDIRVKTKMLAKATMRPIIFKLIFVLLLELITINTVTSLLSALKNRLFEETVVSIWIYNINYIEVVLAIISGIMVFPLSLGIAEYFLKAVRLKQPKITDIFLWYADSAKLKTMWRYFLWISFFSVITLPINRLAADFVVGQYDKVMFDLTEQINAGAQSVTINLGLLDYNNLLICSGLLIFSALVSVKFILIPFIMVDDPTINGFRAAAQSWRVMKGHSLEYLLLVLSFAGWFIASIFTMFLVALYFYPYMRVTIAIFSEYSRADNKIKETTSEVTG